MTDDRHGGPGIPGEGGPPPELELGLPIEAMLNLDGPTTEAFLRGVRRRIRRRDLAASAVDLSVQSWSHVFVSYLSFLLESMFPKNKEETRDG